MISKQISKNKRAVAIVSQSIAVDLGNEFTIFKFDALPNKPFFITITDIPLDHEIPSTYILMPEDTETKLTRVLKFANISELPKMCSDLAEGLHEEKVTDISVYNVGEHFFSNKPPDEKTSNYDDSYDFWIANNDTQIKESATRGVAYEYLLTAVISSFVSPGDIIIDAGTNVGTVSILLSRLHNSSVQVVSYEPFQKTYSILFKNIIQNKTYNVTPIKMALGDMYRPVVHLSDTVFIPPLHTAPKGTLGRTAKINLTASDVHYGAIHLGTGGPPSIMTCIDDLNLTISVLKVDVEGAEPLVFYGARETIKRCMPVIAFEKNENVVTRAMITSLSLQKEVIYFDILKYCYSLGYRDFYSVHISDYVLVPPNRNYVQNRITKFRKVSKFKDFIAAATSKFNLFRLEKAW